METHVPYKPKYGLGILLQRRKDGPCSNKTVASVIKYRYTSYKSRNYHEPNYWNCFFRIRTKFSIIDPLKEANQKARLKTTYVKKVPTNEEAKQSKDVSIIHNTSLLKQYCTIDGVDQLENLRTPLPPPMVGLLVWLTS